MNWEARVAAAERRMKAKQSPAFTAEDKVLAVLWTTCACSELDLRIPKKDHGVPIDFTLMMAGADCMSQVQSDRVPEARVTYNNIQKREAAILAVLE